MIASSSEARSGVSITAPLVIVVDDDESVRRALSSLFRSVGLSVKLFASASDLLEYVPPDVPACLVIDVRLPGMGGLELQTKLLEKSPRLPVIIMTGHGDIPMSVRALKAGAVDFLLKPFRDQEMLDAVTRAIELDRARRAEDSTIADIRSKYGGLSMREKEVLTLVTDGLMNKQIAAAIGVSEITVKIHRGRVMKKMKAKSLPDLVRMVEALKRHPA